MEEAVFSRKNSHRGAIHKRVQDHHLRYAMCSLSHPNHP